MNLIESWKTVLLQHSAKTDVLCLGAEELRSYFRITGYFLSLVLLEGSLASILKFLFCFVDFFFFSPRGGLIFFLLRSYTFWKCQGLHISIVREEFIFSINDIV